MKERNKDNSIEFIGEEPDMEAIRAELDRTVNDATMFIQAQRRAYFTRYCIWSGQSDDGRKWADLIGEDPFPWEGASDTKIRAADAIINEQVAMMCVAFGKAQVQATGMNLVSIPNAQGVTELMKWLFKTQLRAELDIEIELIAQWRQQFGLAIMGVFWEQERQLTQKHVTLQELVDAAKEAAAQGDNGPMQFVEAVLDSSRDEEVVAMLQRLSPVIDKATARRMLKEMRTDGETDVPQIEITKSLPVWVALRPWIDVFFPLNTKTLKTGRWCARREFLLEHQVRDYAEQYGWDKDWVEEAIEKRGQAADLDAFTLDWMQRRARSMGGFYTAQYRDYIEIVYWYQRGLDEKTGMPVLYCTTYSPAVTTSYAKHEPLDYEHRELPFVEFVRERIDFPMTESRGVADIVATWQNEIKTQRDARTDRASIVTMPPLIVPPNKGKTKLEFGPGCQQTERRPGEIRWMQIPPADPSSAEVEAQTKADMDGYFGRYSQTVSPIISQTFAEFLVGKFLREVSRCGVMTLQLCQQYLPPTVVAKVIGNRPVPMQISADDIRGQYTLALTFDTVNLDPELVKKKLEMWQTFILGADTMGIVDRGKYLPFAARLIDPEMADAVVGDPQSAAQSEWADEAVQFAKIVSGVEPEMKEGQNYQLRMQALKSFAGLNPGQPANPEVKQMIAARPVMQQMIANRLKHFEFMIQQHQVNPMVGKVGATPVLGIQG